MDDVLLVCNNNQFITSLLITSLLAQLNHEFANKNLGLLRYFLIVEIKYFDEGVFLSQQKYIRDLLSRTKMFNSNHVAPPQVLTNEPSLSNNVLNDVTTF